MAGICFVFHWEECHGQIETSEDRAGGRGRCSALMAGASAYAADTVGLITKTETNPFFVKMREGAEAKAKELGVTLIAAAGKYRRRQ